MNATRAEKIVGYPFDLVLSPAREPLPNGTRPLRPVWLCRAKHPVYGFEVVAWNEQKHLALKTFVDDNYRAMGVRVFREQAHRCLGCGREMIGRLEVDHIEMRSHGGRRDTRDNLRGLGTTSARGGCECHYMRHNTPGWEPQFTLEDLSRIGQVEGGL